MFKSVILAAATLASFAGAAIAGEPTRAMEAPAGTGGLTCGARTEVVALLKSQFAEEQEDVSLQSDQALVELFASEKGTWSILLSSPNGMSCVVAAGKGLVTQAKS